MIKASQTSHPLRYFHVLFLNENYKNTREMHIVIISRYYGMYPLGIHELHEIYHEFIWYTSSSGRHGDNLPYYMHILFGFCR